MRKISFGIVTIIFILLAVIVFANIQFSAYAWSPTPVATDYLVHMPGSQPGSISGGLPNSSQCDSCHQSNDNTISVVHDWEGSMMGQSARDFLFWATMTVAAQDSIWAIGSPNATDICLRCHFPLGWVNGRSSQTNASLMTGYDYDGVQCTICHYMIDPFFEDTANGTREGNDWQGYWDEANPTATPAAAAALTLNADQSLSVGFSMFNGSSFYNGSYHPPTNYTESGSGQYFFDNQDRRRASFADADAKHTILYSRYHKSKYFCSTCHDISNPVLANLGDDPANPLTTETESAHRYFHVERTFSEFMLSDYGQQGGAPGIGPFAPSQFETSQPGNLIASCQDCHMQDVAGAKAAGQGLIRPSESVEHPNSGQPLHDLTGGNVWVPDILASIDNRGPNPDAINANLLDGRESVLTLDFNQGFSYDSQAIFDGSNRSLQMLKMAAVIMDVQYSPSSGNLNFIIQNQTGHKLISGFPEGRRMFVNIKYYDDSGLIYEVNPYDSAAGTLMGLGGYVYDDPDGVLPDPLALNTDSQAYVDELVYEMHGSTTFNTTEGDETFHFVLSDGRYKDNRIPPMGFDISEAANRLIDPVWQGVSNPAYFTPAEYAGGYDLVSMQNDFGIAVTDAITVEVTLNYQTTSREYIEFLRNEINASGELTLSDVGAGGDPAYLIQTDSFFSALRAWGDTIWDVWAHNMNAPGAAPITIAAGQWDSSSMVTQAVPVNGGWNLLALPLQPQPAMTAQALLDSLNAQSSSGNCSEVDQWVNSAWNSYNILFGGTDFPVIPGQGYFTYCADSFDWVLQGEAFQSGVLLNLLNGWNLLGVPYPDTYTSPSLLAAIGGDCSEIDRWFNSAWYSYNTLFGGDNFDILSQEGYFLYCTTDITFTP